MCGIAGIYCSNANDDFLQKIYPFTHSLAHRGRDANNFFISTHIALGHQRLSIIDLSNNADQPMTSIDGRFTIAYNGELFNYDDIKYYFSHKYPEQFKQLKSYSDTAMILELYSIEGEAIFDRLDGMFSIAIWDQVDKSLILARDPIGIKPLYISQFDNYFCFASELKAFYEILPTTSADHLAIAYYLHLGYIPHPYTILSEVKKFPAGHFAKVKNDKIELYKFHNFNVSNNQNITYSQAREQVKIALEKAVKGALVSDVNMGILLSGGVDSSLVASIASKYQTNPITAFTIEQKDINFNEGDYASKIAAFLGINYKPLMVDYEFLISNLENVLMKMDEPLADSSFLVTHAISAFASNDVKVALSGDGGDELFLGYGMYRWAKRLTNPVINSLKPLANVICKNIPSHRFNRWGQFFAIKDNLHSNIYSVENNFFTSWQINDLLNNEYRLEFQIIDADDAILRQEWFDFNYYLPDDLLVKVDRASMANTLEIRPPLLSTELADLAWSIPIKYKMHGNQLKIMLKDILSDYLPPELYDRPKKGFSIPIANLCRNELKSSIHTTLGNPQSSIFNFINYNFVNNLMINFFEKNVAYLAGRIWNLYVLNYYLESHKL
jgi:asparagine synthase (glutamine-hydrolysing)